ncbi:MAG TPA: AraC family transcriptional regulator [Rhodospirillaceae bacterium]|nr:AraC family transcriptional regulator [Rhodospirillaceae bacterium]
MESRNPLPRVDIAHFDTNFFDSKDRFEAWNENMGVLFDLLAPDGSVPKHDMTAQIDVCNLGDAVFGVTRAQSQFFSRDERRVARDGMDHILVQVFLEGGGVASSDDRINPGDMLIIDLDQPHEMLNTDFANLTMVLPRELHPHLSGLLAEFHGRRLGPDNPMVPFVAEHMCSLWKHVPEMDMGHAGIALKGTLGLLETWLTHESKLTEDVSPEVSLAVGKSIFRYIDQNLGEQLSPELLARTFRISRSQLYRIFAPHGGVSRYIQERRLRRSLHMLSNAVHNGMSIGAIGFACGFSSESQFSKSSKNRYRISPSEARNVGQAAAEANAAGPETMASEMPEFTAWIKSLGR